MQNFWSFCVKLFQYAILLNAVTLAFILWLLGGLIRGISHNPQLVTGARPMGASIVIQGWSRGNLWLLGWVRRRLGRYVQRHHPRAYQRTQRMFQ